MLYTSRSESIGQTSYALAFLLHEKTWQKVSSNVLGFHTVPENLIRF